MVVVLAGGGGAAYWFLLGPGRSQSDSDQVIATREIGTDAAGIPSKPAVGPAPAPGPSEPEPTEPTGPTATPAPPDAGAQPQPDAAQAAAPSPDAAPAAKAASPEPSKPKPEVKLTVPVMLGSFYNPATTDAQFAPLAKALIAKGEGKANVAKHLNRRGMRFYKKKLYAPAAKAFEVAFSVNPLHEHAAYNRACVAGLQGDAATAVTWLKKLKVIGSGKAKKILMFKVPKDHDLDKIRNADVFKAFMRSIR